MTLRPDHETLLQGRIDGTLTDDERAQLDRLLATDSDVRSRAAELDRLAELLDSFGDVEPPAELTQQILSAIGARDVDEAAHDTARITTFDSNASRVARSGARMDGGTVMGKKMMWGLAAAAVIALAVLNFTGVLPPNEGTEGYGRRREALSGGADRRRRTSRSATPAPRCSFRATCSIR